MENRASKNRPFNIAFVLTPELLKRLAVILKEASERLEFTVKFADGTSVAYDQVEEIIEQPNSDRRSIIGVIAEPLKMAVHQRTLFSNRSLPRWRSRPSNTR